MKFALFENPVTEYAKFQIKKDLTETEIAVVNNLGRLVIRNKITNNHGGKIQMKVGQLPSGIYYCYLESKGSISKAIKMIKK